MPQYVSTEVKQMAFKAAIQRYHYGSLRPDEHSASLTIPASQQIVFSSSVGKFSPNSICLRLQWNPLTNRNFPKKLLGFQVFCKMSQLYVSTSELVLNVRRYDRISRRLRLALLLLLRVDGGSFQCNTSNGFCTNSTADCPALPVHLARSRAKQG